jgi:hypothetical protein
MLVYTIIMNWTVIALIVCCVCITSSAALILGDPDKAGVRTAVAATTEPPTVAPVAPVDPVDPVDPVVPQQPQLVQMNGITILHQRVPLLDMGYHDQRYYLVPGAHFPGLQGLRLDDAVRLVMTSFPMLTVRAIMIGEPLAYEFRRDRLTIQYDSFTKRVVTARIG